MLICCSAHSAVRKSGEAHSTRLFTRRRVVSTSDLIMVSDPTSLKVVVRYGHIAQPGRPAMITPMLSKIAQWCVGWWSRVYQKQGRVCGIAEYDMPCMVLAS